MAAQISPSFWLLSIASQSMVSLHVALIVFVRSSLSFEGKNEGREKENMNEYVRDGKRDMNIEV